MDIRYNMINWVHRSTRGWSSGGSVSDPRTGEIIKATVTLGSLRDRQDYMIFEGLLSPYTNGNERPADPLRSRAAAHSPAVGARSRATRSASATTTTTAARAGSRCSTIRTRSRSSREDGTIDLSKAYEQQHRRLGQGGDQLRLPPVPRRAPTSRPSWRRSSMTRGSEDLRYFTNQDTDIHPRVDQWSNGAQPGGRADAADEGPPRRAESHRRSTPSAPACRR